MEVGQVLQEQAVEVKTSTRQRFNTAFGRVLDQWDQIVVVAENAMDKWLPLERDDTTDDQAASPVSWQTYFTTNTAAAGASPAKGGMQRTGGHADMERQSSCDSEAGRPSYDSECFFDFEDEDEPNNF
jgi:hypothetical protein